MLDERNFPWIVNLTKKDVYIDLTSRLSAFILALFYPTLILSLPINNCTLFMLFVLPIGAWSVISRTLHRLLSFYHPKTLGLRKIGLYCIMLVFPVLEFRFLVKEKTEEIIMVPSFFQPIYFVCKAFGECTLFSSIVCFVFGVEQYCNEYEESREAVKAMDDSLE